MIRLLGGSRHGSSNSSGNSEGDGRSGSNKSAAARSASLQSSSSSAKTKRTKSGRSASVHSNRSESSGSTGGENVHSHTTINTITTNSNSNTSQASTSLAPSQKEATGIASTFASTFASTASSKAPSKSSSKLSKRRRDKQRQKQRQKQQQKQPSDSAKQIAEKLQRLRERKARLDNRLEEAKTQRSEERSRRSQSFDLSSHSSIGSANNALDHWWSDVEQAGTLSFDTALDIGNLGGNDYQDADISSSSSRTNSSNHSDDDDEDSSLYFQKKASAEGSASQSPSSSSSSSSSSSAWRNKRTLPLHIQNRVELDPFEANREVLPDHERYRISKIMGFTDLFPSEQLAKMASSVTAPANQTADADTAGATNAATDSASTKENDGVQPPFFPPTSPIRNASGQADPDHRTPPRNMSTQDANGSYFTPSDTSSPQHSTPSTMGSQSPHADQPSEDRKRNAAASDSSNDVAATKIVGSQITTDNNSRASDDADVSGAPVQTKSAIHAAFLESTDMWLQSQQEQSSAATDGQESSAITPSLPDLPTNKRNAGDNNSALEQILQASPAVSFDATFMDVNSSAETEENESPSRPQASKIMERLQEVKQTTFEERLGLNATPDSTEPNSYATPPRNAKDSSMLGVNQETGGDDVILPEPVTPEEKREQRRQHETDQRKALLQQELKTILNETQKTMNSNLSPTIVRAICQAAFTVTYTHKYFDATVDDMVCYPTITETLVDDEQSLSLVKHIDRCYAHLQDEKMIPAELITTLVMVAARLHKTDAVNVEHRETMSMPIDLTPSALEDFVVVDVVPLPVHDDADAVEAGDDEQRDGVEPTASETDKDVDVLSPSSEATNVGGDEPNEDDLKRIPMTPEQREERLQRIRDQMQSILDELKSELGIELSPTVADVLHEAASNVAELKCYMDDRAWFFPSVHDAIMDHTLTAKANDLYIIETDEDEFPVEFTSLLRIVAVRRLEEDDTKYGRALKEKQRNARPLDLEDDVDLAILQVDSAEEVHADMADAEMDDQPVDGIATADEAVTPELVKQANRPLEEVVVSQSNDSPIDKELDSIGSPSRKEQSFRLSHLEIQGGGGNSSNQISGDMSDITMTAASKEGTSSRHEPRSIAKELEEAVSEEKKDIAGDDVNTKDNAPGALEAIMTQSKPAVSMDKPAAIVSPDVTPRKSHRKKIAKQSRLSDAQYAHFSRQKKSSAWTHAQLSGFDALPFDPKKSVKGVYVKDRAFAWLPAKITKHEDDGVIVNIIESDDWEDTTVNSEALFKNSLQRHPSLKNRSDDEIADLMKQNGIRSACSLRKVLFADYTDGELPQQNSLVGSEGKSDMADLIHLHDAAILYNLKDRHYRSKPYTRVGDIVIAMNPFRWINELYSSDTRDEYATHYIWEAHRDGDDGSTITGISEKVTMGDRTALDPHVYEVSSSAYRGLATGGENQTILFTGESGAGKTESVKIVITHLATVQETRPEGVDAEHVTAQEIVSRVCQSSPIFEAFGNAKTTRNDNSSRFGRFIQLQFLLEPEDASINAGRAVPYTDLVGSKTTTYLLEKSRVVHHDDNERSYHIFYQLLAAPSATKDKFFDGFGTSTASDYAFLSQSAALSDGFADEDNWHSTCAALKLFKIYGADLEELMRALIIVLQLGNLTFDEVLGQGTSVTSEEALNKLSAMTGLPAADLESSLTSRLLRTPGNSVDVRVGMPPQAAYEARDALAKDIYARIFDAVVRSMNDFTAFGAAALKSGQSIGHISLLDIFGFENFEVNRFEQFCINYANEKLHNKYVHDNFNFIKAEYEREGIDLYDFALVDNADVLDLLEGRDGLIGSLNEECLRPQGTPENYVLKNKVAFKESNRLIDRKLHTRTEFGLMHFASPVEYDATEFLERNMDTISNDLASCAAKFDNAFIRSQFEELMTTRSSGAADDIMTSPKKKRGRNYVIEKFRQQLHGLMDAMTGSRTRYIRCIKPNNSMTPRLTDHNTTLYQLQCSGLITAIQISKESFPTSLGYDFILSRYSMLIEEQQEAGESGSPDGSKLSALVAAAETTNEKVQAVLTSWLSDLSTPNMNGSRSLPFACGKTKIFFKPGAQERLEVLRKSYYGKRAATIQKHARRKLAVGRYAALRVHTVRLQAFVRMAVVRVQRRDMIQSSTSIASWFRCMKAQREYRGTRAAALKIQSLSRGNLGRKDASTMRSNRAATSIACWTRCIGAQQALRGLREHHAALKIQSFARARSAKLMTGTMRRERAALQIQCIVRIKMAARVSESLRRQKAAITIQAAVRGLPVRKEYSRRAHANEVLQKFARHMLMMRTMKNRLAEIMRVSKMTKQREASQMSSVDAEGRKFERAIDETSSSAKSVASQSTSDGPAQRPALHDMEAAMTTMKAEMAALRQSNEALTHRAEKAEKTNRTLSSQVERADSGALAARTRVAELQKINEGLAKKIFAFKSDNNQLRRSYQSKNYQTVNKLNSIEKKLSAMTSERDAEVARLKDELKEQQDSAMQELQSLRHDKDLMEARYKAELTKMKNELKSTQESHHAYLKQIMEVLEKTQAAREQEAKRINEDLKNIRKKKNDQIVSLHQEIVRLKSEQEAPPVPQEKVKLIQARTEKEEESRARRSAQVDNVVQDIYKLADSKAVPQDIGSMLSDNVELLHHLYRIEEDSQRKDDRTSMELIEVYTQTVKPDEAISKLKTRLMDTLEQVKILQEQVGSGCERCAAIDARIAARSSQQS